MAFLYGPGEGVRRAFSASVFCRLQGDSRRILLIHHKLLKLWLPVGGELEIRQDLQQDGPCEFFVPRPETPLEAAAREVFEETGFTPTFPKIKHAPAGTPRGFLGFEEYYAGPKGYHMNFCFLADVNSDVPKDDGSWSAYRWVNPYDAQGDKSLEMPDNVRDILWKILTTQTE